MNRQTMSRNLDWLGLAIEPSPTPQTKFISPDDNQAYSRGCNFTKNLAATDYNDKGTFTHLYHSNKQETQVFMLNTLIDMIINLSEKFKYQFQDTLFTQKLKQIKNLISAVEHLITQDNPLPQILKQIERIDNKLNEVIITQNNLKTSIERISLKLGSIPSKQTIKELIEIPKRVEEQTLQLLTQISTDADQRLDLIKKLIETFHNEWLG